MAEALATGGGKIAEEMLKEVQEATKHADALQQTNPTQQFSEVLSAQKVGSVTEVGGHQDIVALLRAAKEAQSLPRVPSIGTELNSHPFMSGMHRVLNDVMSGQNKLEKIIDISLHGSNLSSSELLALQAAVYRFSQELELTSKVVEKGTSTIKQTMNTQV